MRFFFFFFFLFPLLNACNAITVPVIKSVDSVQINSIEGNLVSLKAYLSIENTNHYLPNIIIILCILLFLKNNVSEKIINNVLFYVNIFIYISYVLGTVYLYLFNSDLVKISEKYNW